MNGVGSITKEQFRSAPLQYLGGTVNSTLNTGKTGAGQSLSPAYTLDLTGKSNQSSPEIRQLKRTGPIECQTCKKRQYQDGSNDPGVSFKAPGHISPESSGAVVMAHEQEHVINEQINAKQDGRRVISQNVRVFTSICPECGKAYVSGGETRTTTAADPAAQENGSSVGSQIDRSA